MLKAIFYARFHEEKGPTVLHQVPEGSVIPLSNTSQQALFHFPSVSTQIIPRREFCDRPLSLLASHHRIIGFPVCIHNPILYPRSDFIFNFCLVVDEKAEWGAYASVVSKLARLMRNLEEQAGWLTKEEKREGWVKAGERGYGGGNRIFAICEAVLEDLNCYCECMIPIDDSNTLNLKLFPTRPPPPPIQIFHVPLSTVRFSSLQTNTWDLTIQRIIPFIDGINSVQKIAHLADTDLTLTRRAIAHLLYYGCILMLNSFHFGAIYAPTAEIGVFVEDVRMQDECRRYIMTPHSPFKSSSSNSTTTSFPSSSAATAANTTNNSLSSSLTNPPLHHHYQASKHKSSNLNPSSSTTASNPIPTSRATLLTLYTSLRQGLTLRDWCITHASLLSHIDVRRFITFGIIKGFLYRSHRYGIALRAADTAADARIAEEALRISREAEKGWRRAAMSSGWRTPVAVKSESTSAAAAAAVVKTMVTVEEGGGGDGVKEGEVQGSAVAADVMANKEESGLGVKGRSLEDQFLARYLDGCHCLDEVCCDSGLGEREAVRKLRAMGDVVFVNR